VKRQNSSKGKQQFNEKIKVNNDGLKKSFLPLATLQKDNA